MYNCTKNNLKGALLGVLIGYEPNAPECTNSLPIFPVLADFFIIRNVKVESGTCCKGITSFKD